MKVAMKRVKRAEFDPAEVEIMSLGLWFNMPVLDVFRIDSEPQGWAIAMPPFDAGELIESRTKLSRRKLQNTMLQLAIGLHQLHQNGVMHGDVKPQNAVYSSADLASWIDYGLATTGCWANDETSPHAQQGCIAKAQGTPTFMAPNILETAWSTNTSAPEPSWWSNPVDAVGRLFAESEHMGGSQGYGPEVDWWAWALTYFVMLTGKSPFPQSTNMGGLFRSIMSYNIDWRSAEGFPEEVRLLKSILVKKSFLQLQTPQNRVLMWGGNMRVHPILKNDFWFIDLQTGKKRAGERLQRYVESTTQKWRTFQQLYPRVGKCTTQPIDVAGLPGWWAGLAGPSCGLEAVCDSNFASPTSDRCKHQVRQMVEGYEKCACSKSQTMPSFAWVGCCCNPQWVAA